MEALHLRVSSGAIVSLQEFLFLKVDTGKPYCKILLESLFLQ